MAAEAVVNFIGEDKKLLATLQGIEKNVQGLGGTMSNAFKTGLSLFSAEKVLGFGKAAIAAAAGTEKYREKWEGVNKSVNGLMAAVGGPLIDMIDKLVPSIERITEKITEWGPAIVEAAEQGGEAWVGAQRTLAGVIGGLMPGVSKEDALAEFDRQQEDAAKQAEQRSKERKQQKEKEATFKPPSWDAIKTEGAKLFDLTPEQKAQRAINQGINFVGGAIGGALPQGGMKAAGSGGENPFLSALKEWGNTQLAKATGLGKVAGAFVQDAFSEQDGEAKPKEAFQSSIVDLKGLFNQIQQSAASTPELQETKKVATNTAAMKLGIDTMVENGTQLLDQMKRGIVAMAG
jgi:hypothetical protein